MALDLNTPRNTLKPMVANMPSTKNKPSRLLFDKLGETQFTSLKFSDARDGFNRQIDDEPLIVKPLPVDPYSTAGYIGVSPKEKDAALENQERIKRFFSTPRGKSFIDKQIGLQLSNTRLESAQGLIGIGGLNINPELVRSAIDISADIIKSGLDETNFVGAVTLFKRPVTRTAISSLQIYNPQNTLDQIGSDPYSGWNHYDRFGSTNILLANDKYLNIVTQNNDTNQSRNNRLVGLNKSLGTGRESEKFFNKLAEKLTNGLKTLNRFTNKANSFFNQGLGIANALGYGNDPKVISTADKITNGFNVATNKLAIIDRALAPLANNIIDQYEGGPGSLNGIGPTIIRRYDNTSGLEKLPRIRAAAENALLRSRNLLVGEDNKTVIAKISNDYREATGDETFEGLNNPTQISNKVYDHGYELNYRTVYATNLPKKRREVIEVKITDTEISETINFIEPKPVNINKGTSDFNYFIKGKFNDFNRKIPVTDEEKTTYNNSVNNVVFTPINPFSGTPFLVKGKDGKPIEGSGRLNFEAYISNFKDNYVPTWNDINYVGRAETFNVFTKFKRDIAFTLQIPCFNHIELREKHQTLSALASINAGFYSGFPSNAQTIDTLGYDPNSNDQKMGGVITYLKLGNYLSPNSARSIKGEPGIITNLTITIPNDASWDIDQQLAQYLTVDIGFKVIHNVLPEFSEVGFLGGIGSSLAKYTPIDIQAQQLIELQNNINSAIPIEGTSATTLFSNSEPATYSNGYPIKADQTFFRL
jgi:hypothetical protein